MSKDKNNFLINDEINIPRITVIGADGNNLGVMSSQKGLSLAQEAGLDLVLISPNAKVPVCKILDYGKFRFEQAKKQKEFKKKQKTIEVKEIQLSARIDKHDMETKAKNALRFIEAGDRVYVVLRLRGRENAMPERGRDVMNTFLECCSDFAVVVKPLVHEGNSLMMTLGPKS